MINKVFKTIFILSLCLAVSLPTNAGSVSVSDGSAFITKSEMAYQMNNMSNRMTQLELSLDSKIDKLVSSYLTRNGIWNGVKQEVGSTGTGLKITYGFVRGSSYNAAYYYNFSAIRGDTSTDNMQIFTNRAMYSVNSAPANTTYNMISSVSKSGLMYVNTIINNHQMGSDNRCYASSVNRSVTQIASDHFKFLYNFSVIFLVNGIEKSRVSCDLMGSATGMYLDVPPLKAGQFCFFVDKNDVVNVRTETIFQTDANTNWSNTLAWLSGNGKATYDYNIVSANVY